MKKILVIGASSEIAMACARRWLEVETEGVQFFLVGRSREKLTNCSEDLLARGATDVHASIFDLTDTASYADILNQAIANLGHIDIALIAHGSLPVQVECDQDVSLTEREFFINATSVICWLSALGKLMELKSMRGSTIAVITSVAGDRGRESNFLYGSAKAAVSTFCDGLRIRLGRCGIHVTDIRPGMVDTVMTKDLDLPQPLLADPDQVAQVIVKAIYAHREIVYAPKYWWCVMIVIRSIPRFIFKRLKL